MAEGTIEFPEPSGLVPNELIPSISGAGIKVAVVASSFNRDISQGLVAGAVKELLELGVSADDVLLVWVPGAFEIPSAVKWLAASRNLDAVVALGAVIKGETDHYEHVARECASGLMRVMLETGLPVSFGVLTCPEKAQALARSSEGPNNKGREAARAAVWAACLRRKI